MYFNGPTSSARSLFVETFKIFISMSLICWFFEAIVSWRTLISLSRSFDSLPSEFICVLTDDTDLFCDIRLSAFDCCLFLISDRVFCLVLLNSNCFSACVSCLWIMSFCLTSTVVFLSTFSTLFAVS